MNLLDRLEKHFGWLAIPNLTLLLVAGQSACFFLGMVDPQAASNWVLVPQQVLDGEIWRLLTFVFVPPGTSILVIFAIYLFYLMGSALEGHWGHFRFNVFVLVGYLATVGVSFLTPDQPASIGFLGTSVFLAFAWLYPDFQILLFFLIPVKVKYLALLTWIGYFISLIVGSWMTRLLVLASLLNFLLFFGSAIYHRARWGQRQMRLATQRVRDQNKPFHECAVCGVTEKIDPQIEFRICSKCEGPIEYCENHLRDHEHLQSVPTEN